MDKSNIWIDVEFCKNTGDRNVHLLKIFIHLIVLPLKYINKSFFLSNAASVGKIMSLTVPINKTKELYFGTVSFWLPSRPSDHRVNAEHTIDN